MKLIFCGVAFIMHIFLFYKHSALLANRFVSSFS